MKAAWQVTGEPKKDKAEIIEQREARLRAVRPLARVPRPQRPTFYPFLKDWQAMIASGGTAKEAETLATAFQELIVGVLLEEREVKKENDIIKARALPTAKPKEPANLPNEFKTNDDFCPGCGLELRSMTKERTALYRDVFVVDLDPTSASPARQPNAGPAALPRLGPRTAARSATGARLIEALRKDIEAMEKALPPKYAYVHGVRDLETPADPQVHLRGNPMRLGDTVPRGFLTVLSPRATDHVHDGQRPARAGAHHRRPADRAARDRQPRLEGALRHRARRTRPSNFGVNGERPTHPELLDYLAQSFVDQRLVDQGAAPRDHAERASIS